jgi:hypothetical protein
LKIVLAGGCLCFGIVLWGCTPVVSVRPLYTQTEIDRPHLDQRVEGEWNMPNLDDSGDDDAANKPPCRVHISEPKAGELPYAVEFRCPGPKDGPGESYSKYDVCLVALDTNTFFDARFAESEEKGKHLSFSDIQDSGIAPAHLLGQAWVQEDFVRFGPLESDWVEKNWPTDFLAISKVGTYSRVDILTSQTKDLRDLLSQNAGSSDAFGFALYLCRPGADCDARAIQDQLARTPNNRDILTGSVKFYAKRGNFARAIVLQRHKIALGSDEAADQLELGRLLLLTRDFDGARRVFATAKEQSDTVSAIKVLTVRSYFLEGNYAGTVQTSKSLEASGKLISADPIILSYFALHRLGRVKEAESYLQQHAATFVGPAEEHLLLLEVSGRVTDSWASKDWTRSTYYYALNALKNKNLNHGREHLHDLATMRPKDDLIGLAAQIELERLPSPANK